MFGQGYSNNGTYTANVTDYVPSYYTRGVSSITVAASYVTGLSLNGTYYSGGTFSGAAIPNFTFASPAVLSNITGLWSGILSDYGETAAVTVNSNGTFTGVSSLGCPFSGTIAPDASNTNFFDVSLTFGGIPCQLLNQTVSGIAVDYLLSDNVTRQLVVAATSGNMGILFTANR